MDGKLIPSKRWSLQWWQIRRKMIFRTPLMNGWRLHTSIHLPTWQIQFRIIYRHELRIELLRGYMMWSNNLRPLLNPTTMDGILHRWSIAGINCLSISLMYRYSSSQLIIGFFYYWFTWVWFDIKDVGELFEFYIFGFNWVIRINSAIWYRWNWIIIYEYTYIFENEILR